ncbi:MAG: hypothetical protein HY908_37920 [Myxococcales bacterium]|nr:hypothetical protein [Myxococcales bacterium]
MRTLWLAFLLLLVPTLAWAGDEDKVQGGWRVDAVRQGKTEMQLPPGIDLAVRFDKASRGWSLDAKIPKESHSATGKWSLAGNKVTFELESVDGQKLPHVAGLAAALDFAFEGDRLVLTYERISIVLGRAPPAKP